MIRILLTGSAGFIGSRIGMLAERAGHEVVRVDLMLPEAHGSREGPAGTHRLDVRAAADWADLLDGVDVVCHQAALVGAGVRVTDLERYAGHNVLGTAALLSAMAERGVDRLVLASSMVVYGEGSYRCPDEHCTGHGPQRPGPRAIADLEAGHFDHACPECGGALAYGLVAEDAAMDPRGGYAASKVAQEDFVRAWVREGAGAAIALRYHNVYGPGMPRDTPYSGVAAMFRSALERGESPRVFEDGAQLRDFVHVDDVARANLLAIEAIHSEGFAAYNVCSGVPISIAEVAAHLAAATGGAVAPNVTGEFRAGDVRHVLASPAKAAAELGFTAAVPPEVGLVAFAGDPLRE